MVALPPIEGEMTTITRTGPSGDFESLLSGCTNRDPAAINALYDRYRPMLERYARRLGGADPEGIANLAFFDGLRAAPNLRSRTEASFRSYLFRAAGSRIASERRKATLDLTHLGDEEPRCPAGSEFDEAVVESSWVKSLVGSLSNDQRDVINDRFFAGYTTSETADRLGKSPGAVRKLQHDAIKRLRRTLYLLGVAVVVAGVLAVLTRDGDERIIVEAPVADEGIPDSSLPGAGEDDGSGATLVSPGPKPPRSTTTIASSGPSPEPGPEASSGTTASTPSEPSVVATVPTTVAAEKIAAPTSSGVRQKNKEPNKKKGASDDDDEDPDDDDDDD